MTDRIAELEAAPKRGWTCFHCGETFHNVGPARDHFGAAPNAEAGCVISAKGQWAILHELRRTELERDLFEVRWNACQLGADHSEAVERFKAQRETYFFPKDIASETAKAEVAHLQARVRELEGEVAALLSEREAMGKALEGIDTFAWSALRADCTEAAEEGNKRINACKAALRSRAKPEGGGNGS